MQQVISFLVARTAAIHSKFPHPPFCGDNFNSFCGVPLMDLIAWVPKSRVLDGHQRKPGLASRGEAEARLKERCDITFTRGPNCPLSALLPFKS